MQIWEPSKLREVFEAALVNGEARFTLSTERDAERFRSALYNYRLKTGIGTNLVVERRGDVIVVRRIETPEIKILTNDGDAIPLSGGVGDEYK